MIRTTMIPPLQGTIKVWFYGDGTTADIMRVIEEIDRMPIKKGFDLFAKQFKPTYRGLKQLWEFVRYKIAYKADSENPLATQDVKDPYSLWHLGVGDCKSKTVFINAVLRCLKIPHFIRYAAYNETNYTHVYTVALLQGKRIIIDSVYNYFDQEAPYSKIKDVDNMAGTTIRSIHGIESINFDACARLQELKQRKEYVLPQEPIPFNQISEGMAALKILERRFNILKAMSDDKTLVEKGLKMVQYAIMKGSVPTGITDDSLRGVGIMIDKFLKQQGTKAINEGVNVERFKVSYQKAKNELKKGNIGAFPERKCVWDDWFLRYNPRDYPNDFAQNNTNAQHSINVPCPWLRNGVFEPRSKGYDFMELRKGVMFYFYGVNSEFRASFSQVTNDERFIEMHLDLIDDGLIRRAHPNYWDTIVFDRQSVKNAYYDYMKLEIPVMSNFVNSIFAADNTMVNGTVSPAVFYPFVDDVSRVTGRSLNDFPATVLTKKVFQDQFLASCNLFSGVSKQNLRLLSGNCCLFDNGEMPNVTIKKLLKIYDPKIQWVAEVIAGVIALVGGIIAAVYEGEAQLSRAKKESSKVDPFASQQANFPTRSDAIMTAGLDWLPKANPNPSNTGNNNNSTNSNSNSNNNQKDKDKKEGSIFPLVVGVAGLLLAAKKKRK